MKRTWLAALAVVAASAASAQTNPYPYRHPGAYPPPYAMPQQMAPQMRYPQQAPVDFAAADPDDILRQGVDRLKGFLARGGAANADEVRAFLDQEISPFFDFDYMARWAGGPIYMQMNEEERADFAAKLKGLFFAALARNLGTYAEPTPAIDIFPARAKGYGREVTVTARVTPQGPGALPVRLDFRFYPSRAGWKIFDVTANGTSAVTYYRNYFREVARRGSIEACCR